MDFWRDDIGRIGVDNEAFLGRHPLVFLPEDPVGDLGAKFLDRIVRVQCERLEIFAVVFDNCSVRCRGIWGRWKVYNLFHGSGDGTKYGVWNSGGRERVRWFVFVAAIGGC